MTDQKNLLVAIILSIAILLGFQIFYELPRMQQQQAELELQQKLAQEQQGLGQQDATAAPEAVGEGAVPPPLPDAVRPTVPGAPSASVAPTGRTRADVIGAQSGAGERIAINTPRLNGSLRVVGGRIDDLTLEDYHLTPEPSSPEIVLFSPSGSPQTYFAEFGWVPAVQGVSVPGPATRWTADGSELTSETPVTLSWDNGEGLRFEKTVAVDDNYMFTVTQRVVNTGGETVTLLPYGLVSRHGTPPTLGYFILHEGPIAVMDGTLQEWNYSELAEEGAVTYESTGGWIGITDKYWLAALVPEQGSSVNARMIHELRGGDDLYQVDVTNTAREVRPGESLESTTRLFAGAKQVKLLDAYADQYSITNFDLAVDFGWFYFLTKPFFYALDFLNQIFGNFGVAILIFTVLVKLVFYPLADRSYRAMSKMKKIQPEVMKLRERYGEDKMKMNEELMALYKKEGANPVSGCLPILIQIPVFFALYKVLFVTIEMRHAPFFGWIQDLSAPDPTTIFNLFGVIPWTPPDFLMIGVWPLFMGLTMWFQQRLNPAPPDPVQAKIFMFLPIMFTFLLARFPAGLVIYWAWNNALSILQQWTIMKRMGVKV